MSDHFTMIFDPEIAAIRVTLSGRWSMAIAQDYMYAVVANIRAAPPGAAPRKALYDLRGCDLHSREVANTLTEFHARVTPDMDKVAFLAGSTLEGLQAKRISSGKASRVFAELDAARAWLAEG